MTHKQINMPFFVICSQSLSKFKVELFYAGQNKITKWMNDFFFISIPSRNGKENLKMYSCGELVKYGMTQ